MKKKTYTRPQTNIICVETEGIICNSIKVEISSPDNVQEDDKPEQDKNTGLWLAE